MKKLISLLLTLAMVFALASVGMSVASADELKPADVTLTRNGAVVEMKAVFADGETYVFAVDTDAKNGKARLLRGKEGKLEAVLLSE